MTKTLLITVILSFVVVLVLGLLLLLRDEVTNFGVREQDSDRLKVAVVGDSDSHSYRDRVNDVRRGGRYHEATFNWAEIWARLRPGEVDMGPFAAWGSRLKIAQLRAMLGLHAKTPIKEDFKFNYALSGAECASIDAQWHFQGRWLLNTVRTGDWDDELIVIRIGINDLGQRHHLDKWAKTGYGPEASRRVEACSRAISDLVHAVRRESRCRIAIIGISHDYNTYGTFESWPSHSDIVNISEVLSIYDAKLASIADENDRVLFIEDKSWLISRIGDRLEHSYTGKFRFGTEVVEYGPRDHPLTIMIEDGHAGTLASGLWLQNFISEVNAAWSLGLTNIEDVELLELLQLAEKPLED